jgi:hypothetical protein
MRREQNRPWVLRTLIYEDVNLERQGGMVWTIPWYRPTYIPFTHFSKIIEGHFPYPLQPSRSYAAGSKFYSVLSVGCTLFKNLIWNNSYQVIPWGYFTSLNIRFCSRVPISVSVHYNTLYDIPWASVYPRWWCTYHNETGWSSHLGTRVSTPLTVLHRWATVSFSSLKTAAVTTVDCAYRSVWVRLERRYSLVTIHGRCEWSGSQRCAA